MSRLPELECHAGVGIGHCEDLRLVEKCGQARQETVGPFLDSRRVWIRPVNLGHPNVMLSTQIGQHPSWGLDPLNVSLVDGN